MITESSYSLGSLKNHKTRLLWGNRPSQALGHHLGRSCFLLGQHVKTMVSVRLVRSEKRFSPNGPTPSSTRLGFPRPVVMGLLWGWVCHHATSARLTQDGHAGNRDES